ncbi:hypothetical protein CVT24_007509 [Panaeolus cyanescens]|uniref:Uncharacterized protein n=1 Tax=Panaeolus cyanescens TaxID=181874 RepID=A0A409WLA7_9AGAR|nr:hypothetical protein CVT24_007509 [Panaeolus cyanescens]
MPVEFIVVGGEHSGLVASFKYLPSFAPQGPPLPFSIEYSTDRDKIEAIQPLIEILLNSGDGMSTHHREVFTRNVVAKAHSLRNTIWMHRAGWYSLLNSPKTRKMISFDYDTISALINDISDPSHFHLRKCPDIVTAVVWMIAGGNQNLRKWNLSEWCIEKSSKSAPRQSSFVRPFPFTTPLPSLAASSSKNLSKDVTEQLMNVSMNENIFQNSTSVTLRSTPKKPKKNITQPGPISSSSSNRSIVIAPHINPTSLLSPPILPPRDLEHTLCLSDIQLVSNGAIQRLKRSPIVCLLRRKFHSESRTPPCNVQVVEAHGRAQVKDLGLSSCIQPVSSLHPLVELYLHSHGWDLAFIKSLETVAGLEPSLDPFVATLGDMGMPLAEATFLWHLMTAQHRHW